MAKHYARITNRIGQSATFQDIRRYRALANIPKPKLDKIRTNDKLKLGFSFYIRISSGLVIGSYSHDHSKNRVSIATVRAMLDDPATSTIQKLLIYGWTPEMILEHIKDTNGVEIT